MSIDRVFVIGAGLMGHGIAQVSAAAGKQVTLSDRTAELAKKGRDRIAGNLARQVEKGKLDQAGAEAILGRVATAQRDQYRIYFDEAELPAEPSGALWYRTPDRAGMPVVGDWVAARVLGPQAIVEAVLPRNGAHGTWSVDGEGAFHAGPYCGRLW